MKIEHPNVSTIATTVNQIGATYVRLSEADSPKAALAELGKLYRLANALSADTAVLLREQP